MSTSTSTAPPRSVSLAGFRHSLRLHWRQVLALTLAGLLLAALWSVLQTKQYTATASGVISAGVNSNIGTAISADNLAKSKATQYQVLANDPLVIERAYERAKVAGPQKQATVAVPLDTAQITISVTQEDPKAAAALANAWIDSLARSISDVENQQLAGEPKKSADATSTDGGPSVIRLQQLTKAVPPDSPSYPPTRLALPAGLLLGLLAGAGYALVRMVVDRRIRSAEVLETEAHVAVVGTIPVQKGVSGASRLLTAHDDPRFDQRERARTAEAFNELRTNLQFMNPDRPPRVIAVTSALPAEGKSTVAANLALTLAAAGEQVVLVDGDLRRPTVARSFSVIEGVGLADAVVGRASLDEVLQDVPGYPTLQVLGAGPIPPNPSEILGSDRFGHHISTLAEGAMVIVDAPPLLPVTDAAIVAARFDGALLVVKAGTTTIDEVRKARQVLQRVQATMLGAVLNQVPTNKGDARRYQYYGGQYSYTQEGGSPRSTPAVDEGAPSGGSTGGGAAPEPTRRSEVHTRRGRRRRDKADAG